MKQEEKPPRSWADHPQKEYVESGEAMGLPWSLALPAFLVTSSTDVRAGETF